MTMAQGGTMTGTGYTLVIGDKNYSSWSLRPWLALKACGAAFEEERIRLRQADSKGEIFRHSPSGKVPVLKTDIGVIYDSLSIVEYLASSARARPTSAGTWPANGIPAVPAVEASASKAARGTPGWIFNRS